MCGRFTSHIPPHLIIELFGLPEHPTVSARYNIAPTQMVPVIRRQADGQNRLDHLRWGLIPSWSKDPSVGSKMINARSETVAEKPAFKEAIRRRRCLVPASSFYEWKKNGKEKVPHCIRFKNGSPMVFAGIWDRWRSPEGEVVESCAILTTAANTLVARLHDRMPVILPPEDWEVWLDRTACDPAQLVRLYRPSCADQMEAFAVSALVNSVKNDAEDLIAPAVCEDLFSALGAA